MPMPSANQSWPPPGLVKPHRDIACWSAWWSGDTDALTQVYGGYSTTENSFQQQGSWAAKGGLVGAARRWFWGTPPIAGQKPAKLHVPLASEIAQVSADLLYGEPPKVTAADDDTTQEALDRLIDEHVHTVLHDSAESSAALGSKWLRIGIDKTVKPDGPIVSLVDADAAYPTYRYGLLVDVLFLSEFEDRSGAFWRHFELHRRTEQGEGVVEHALFYGDAQSVGRRMALDDHPATAHLAPLVQELPDGSGQGVLTGVSRLSVVGGPNARSRTWRQIPDARHLGRADISGLEPVLDAFDDVWSSWMRDIRHGRSRIHVPQLLLQSGGPGKAASVNLEEEIYIGLNSMPSDERGMEISAQQFAIRHVEHAATLDALHEHIVSGAGYSPQTFGIDSDGALTATESWNRQVRTKNTRAGKVRRERPIVAALAPTLLEFDRVHFAGKGNPDAVIEVKFQESVSDSQEGRARTAQLLRAAKAASTETLVAMQHPDWSGDDIKAEAKLILDEDRVEIGSPLDAFADMEDTPPSDDEDPAADDTEDEDGDGEAGGDDPAGPPRPSPFPRRQRTRGGTR